MEKTLKGKIIQQIVQTEGNKVNELADAILSLFSKAVEKALAQREREIEKLLYTEGGFLREDENVASDILSKLQETEKKDIDARWG